MRIGVIGGGTVGRATARAFIEHVDEVRVWDVVKERATCNLYRAIDSDIVFVCLPTPQKPGSIACDTSIVESFFADATDRNRHDWEQGAAANYVLRSTVPIGFTKYLAKTYKLLNLVHSPEFLTARCAVTDAHLPSRNIIGVPYGPVRFDDGSAYYNLLHELYGDRFPGVQIFNMSSDESEAVKLFTNGFFATKIAYFNEVRTLADKLGLDWERVMEGVLSDGRIAHSHTKVPGPDGKFGFGGECLVKDLNSLIHQIVSNGLSASVTSAAVHRNEDDRRRS